MKKRSGFTLIDLIVTIAIIGVLVGAAIPAYSVYVKKSREAEAVNALGEIQAAQRNYKSDPGLGAGSYANNLGILKWKLEGLEGTIGNAPARYTYSTNPQLSKAVSSDPTKVVHATILLHHDGALEYINP